MTGAAGVFAGGDAVPSERTVTVGVGHGKKAARAIDAWLRGEAFVHAGQARRGHVRQAQPLVLRRRTTGASRPCSTRDPGRRLRRGGAGLAQTEAAFEAGRCLSCGNCFECDGCLGACPEDAVIKLGVGQRYRFDYDQLHRLRHLLPAVPRARHRDGPGGTDS